MTSDTKNKVLGAFLTLLGGACWGTSGSMGQYLFQNEGMDSRWLVPIRLGLAGVILAVYCLFRYKGDFFRPWKTSSDRIHLLIYGILGVSFCQFTYFLTIQLSSAGIGTIMQDLSPVMILIVTCFIAKRKPGMIEIVSIVLALAGVILITTHGDMQHMAVPISAIITGVICACGVTVYNMEPIVNRYPITVLQAWAFLMGGCLLALFFRPWNYGYIPTATGVFGIAFVVVIGNVVAFTSYMKGVQLIGPQKSILYGFSEPVTAAVIGVLVLGNTFTFWDAMGFACIFAMITLISRN